MIVGGIVPLTSIHPIPFPLLYDSNVVIHLPTRSQYSVSNYNRKNSISSTHERERHTQQTSFSSSLPTTITTIRRKKPTLVQ
jgi:hypothetical protein